MKAGFPCRSLGRTEPGRIRRVNEDAFLACDSAGLWAVSDGMGGHSAGDVASQIVIDELKSVATASKLTKEEVERSLRAANAMLFEQSAQLGLRRRMGATAAVLGIRDSRFFCLWVGDSRVYRLRSNQFTQLTRDHRLVQELVDVGALDQNAARHHPRRNILMRAVGLQPELVVDGCNGAVQENDIYLLTTDEVTGLCEDDELSALLELASLSEISDEIVARCYSRGGHDNLAFVVVRIVGPVP
jgi:serine/threonine protein phosphatase PrpC